jgi:hypothetical protein
MGLASLSGCQVDKARAAHEYAYETGVLQQAEEESRTRLLVRTASATVAVVSVPDAISQVESIVAALGGRVQSSRIAKDAPAHLDLRVPADRLVEALDRFAALGEERERNTGAADVTDEVADAEAELANKRALRDRLRVLLERAKEVKEVLAVEQELTRLQTEIDTLEGRLERLRTDVALSAVNLTLVPEKKPRILGPLGYLYVGTKWFITKLFVIRE